MTYSKRTSAPSESNPCFLHYTAGGYNRCIEIKNGSVLPNCVGYAWGRWYEILKEKPSLSRSNAENWYGCTTDGYQRGTTPKIGAVICWKKGEVGNESDGAGHVAVVEEIYSDGSILTSNSMYGGSRFYTKKLTPPLYQLNDKAYIFQGFIYLPIEFEKAPDGYTTGDYRVTDAWLLNVREGAGTSYPKKKYKDFTKNAREQIYEIYRQKIDGYVRGVEFTVYEVKGNWGRTPSGWVCLDYCKKPEATQ